MPSYCLFETAIGTCGVAWNERGLIGVQLPEADRAATERRLKARAGGGSPAEPPPTIAEATAALERHFAGERSDFSAVPVDLSSADPFHAKVYTALREIGWGATVTYGELAAKAGAPGEAQAVGIAMARNRTPIVVPCHRVLGTPQKKGEVNAGGFSAYGGVATKAKLLALEGVDIGPRQKRLF